MKFSCGAPTPTPFGTYRNSPKTLPQIMASILCLPERGPLFGIMAPFLLRGISPGATAQQMPVRLRKSLHRNALRCYTSPYGPYAAVTGEIGKMGSPVFGRRYSARGGVKPLPSPRRSLHIAARPINFEKYLSRLLTYHATALMIPGVLSRTFV